MVMIPQREGKKHRGESASNFIEYRSKKKKKKEKEDRSICERVIPFQLRDAVICYSMMSIETAQFPDPRFDAKL